MTTETILARVNSAIKLDFSSSAALELRMLADDLAAQIRLESAASKGVGNATKTVTKMLNALKKDDPRKSLHYAWTDADGRQCVCDGYRAFRLTAPLPLEPRPDDAGKPINMDLIFTPYVNNSDYIALELPSIGEVKAQIAIARAAKEDAVWDFGEGKPAYNAFYLLDLLTVIPDATTLFAKNGGTGRINTAFAVGENGEAAILPVRKSNDCNVAKAAEDAAIKLRDVHAYLESYTNCAAKDPDYAVTLEHFERLSRYAYQPAA